MIITLLFFMPHLRNLTCFSHLKHLPVQSSGCSEAPARGCTVAGATLGPGKSWEVRAHFDIKGARTVGKGFVK